LVLILNRRGKGKFRHQYVQDDSNISVSAESSNEGVWIVTESCIFYKTTLGLRQTSREQIYLKHILMGRRVSWRISPVVFARMVGFCFMVDSYRHCLVNIVNVNWPSVMSDNNQFQQNFLSKKMQFKKFNFFTVVV
jgi:hypothetical protein